MWLSIGAALATIALKTLARLLTDSVAFQSDAAESVVNLVAALVALVTIRWATRPLDDEHMYGHEKAAYFSAGVEGALILAAAASIAFYAVGRLIHPVEIADGDVGIAVSTLASLITVAVATVMIRAGCALVPQVTISLDWAGLRHGHDRRGGEHDCCPGPRPADRPRRSGLGACSRPR